MKVTNESQPVAKRRIALLRSLARPDDAIKALLDLLEFSPTDVEAWTELSDLYFSLALYSQAIYCLGEVLLVAPNAWNVSPVPREARPGVTTSACRLLTRVRCMHVLERSPMSCPDRIPLALKSMATSYSLRPCRGSAEVLNFATVTFVVTVD